ncbi:MAG: aldehyde dehydrogenase family protein [Thiolinea sp.]
MEGAGNEVGSYLVQHPQIAAAAFTGSTRGGLALQALANARTRPIPFYGELGAVNPVLALPAALAAGGEALAQTLAGSITMGCGQFCTNPGTLVVLDDPATDTFLAQLQSALRELHPHAMLTEGMSSAFASGIARQQQLGAEVLLHNEPAGDAPGAFLASVSATDYLSQPEWQEEVFGPSSLVVRCNDVQQVLDVLHAIGGSLTVTVWGAEQADADIRALVRTATQIAGRVLFKGVPTGVAVTAAQMHGGPFPASTAPLTTSVGDSALDRFLRPVALQDMPEWLVTEYRARADA